MTTDEVTQLINHEDAEVIDIRSQTEFENGHIINAKNIGLQELPERINKLRKDKSRGIIFYCSNGSLSLKETQDRERPFKKSRTEKAMMKKNKSNKHRRKNKSKRKIK